MKKSELMEMIKEQKRQMIEELKESEESLDKCNSFLDQLNEQFMMIHSTSSLILQQQTQQLQQLQQHRTFAGQEKQQIYQQQQQLTTMKQELLNKESTSDKLSLQTTKQLIPTVAELAENKIQSLTKLKRIRSENQELFNHTTLLTTNIQKLGEQIFLLSSEINEAKKYKKQIANEKRKIAEIHHEKPVPKFQIKQCTRKNHKH